LLFAGTSFHFIKNLFVKVDKLEQEVEQMVEKSNASPEVKAKVKKTIKKLDEIEEQAKEVVAQAETRQLVCRTAVFPWRRSRFFHRRPVHCPPLTTRRPNVLPEALCLYRKSSVHARGEPSRERSHS
jgi:hypothetical protein